MKYALLIHGPFANQWLIKIKKQIFKFKYKFNQIVLVSYVSDKENYETLLNDLNLSDNVTLISVKDVINPGFFNINRQLLTVNAGLESIENSSFVIKLRNDQSVDFNKLIKYADKNKIITTNCYTRSDRLYHPSDMLLCGTKEELKILYSLPLVPNTHIMTIYENKKICRDNPDLKYLPISPESMLCRHYLQEKGWNIKETKKDSFEAIKNYYIVLNSWNIDFRSTKKRTHLCPKNYLILPHYFTTKPFADFQDENAACYQACDFNGKFPGIKDLYYLCFSKLVWLLWKHNKKGLGIFRRK